MWRRIRRKDRISNTNLQEGKKYKGVFGTKEYKIEDWKNIHK
jgi:hypothetical protein